MNKYNYKPLPDFLTIKDSPIDGLGVFTTVHINKEFFSKSSGFSIGNTHVVFNGRVIRTPFGGFINHSDNPNLRLGKTLIPYDTDKYKDWYYVGAFLLNDIKEGEELTLDYNDCFKVLGINCEIGF